jgi:hypothetical protein
MLARIQAITGHLNAAGGRRWIRGSRHAMIL